jgi:hypothetical protein
MQYIAVVEVVIITATNSVFQKKVLCVKDPTDISRMVGRIQEHKSDPK